MDAGDLELVARANRSDATAFDELYRRYRGWALRLATHRLGNIDEAADAVQDIFLQFYQRFPGFSLTSTMTTFLYPIVIRVCRDRRAKQRPTIDIDDADDAPELIEVDDGAGSDVGTLLARLTPEQSKLLMLYFVEDMPLPKLAETYGVPPGTIKSRIHYAVAALRQKAVAPVRRRGAL